jgi:hypothetical protein
VPVWVGKVDDHIWAAHSKRGLDRKASNADVEPVRIKEHASCTMRFFATRERGRDASMMWQDTHPRESANSPSSRSSWAPHCRNASGSVGGPAMSSACSGSVLSEVLYPDAVLLEAFGIVLHGTT